MQKPLILNRESKDSVANNYGIVQIVIFTCVRLSVNLHVVQTCTCMRLVPFTEHDKEHASCSHNVLSDYEL